MVRDLLDPLGTYGIRDRLTLKDSLLEIAYLDLWHMRVAYAS